MSARLWSWLAAALIAAGIIGVGWRLASRHERLIRLDIEGAQAPAQDRAAAGAGGVGDPLRVQPSVCVAGAQPAQTNQPDQPAQETQEAQEAQEVARAAAALGGVTLVLWSRDDAQGAEVEVRRWALDEVELIHRGVMRCASLPPAVVEGALYGLRLEGAAAGGPGSDTDDAPTLSLEVIESTPLGWADWVWCVLLIAAMAARLKGWSLRDPAPPRVQGAPLGDPEAQGGPGDPGEAVAPHWGRQHPASGLLLFVVAQGVLGSGVLTLLLRVFRVGQVSALGMLAQALVMITVHLGIVYGMAGVEHRSLAKARWALGAHASRQKRLGLGAAAGLGAALGIGATILLALVLDGPQETSPMQEAVRMPGTMLALAAMATLSPWYEELLFRGYVQGSLTSRVGAPVAAALAAALFGLVHVPQHLGYLWPVLPIFAVSAAASALRAWSGSTAPPFALHLGYNVALVLPAMLMP